MRILIAEDNETVQKLLTEVLESRGHSIVSVADGHEALAAFAHESFDVVLLDEEMPRMNGLEATRAIRQKEPSAGKHQRIVGMTGNPTEENEERYLEAGMDAILPKPICMERLFQAIESAGSMPGEVASAQPGSAQPVAASEAVALHLRRTTGGNEKLVRSLVKTFLSDAPKKISTIRHAIANRDAERLASAAHSLKGSLDIFDAEEAATIARNLEAMGRARNLNGAKDKIHTLEEELATLKRHLLVLQSAMKPGAQPRRRRSRSRRKR
jgi:CheY-like chemotaxis protein